MSGKKRSDRESDSDSRHDLGVLLDAVALRLDEASGAASRAVEAIESDAAAPEGDTPESERARIELELTDNVRSRLEDIVRQCDQLAEILRMTSGGLSTAEAPATPAAEALPGARRTTKAPPVDGEVGDRGAGGEGVSAGLRLITTQMAVAGSSREEIEQRLEEEFGVKKPGDVVNAVLGPVS